MEKTKLMIEVPTSLMEEVNKFLAEKAKGKSLQGTKRIIVVRSLYDYLIKSGYKVNNTTVKECMEIIGKARFQI